MNRVRKGTVYVLSLFLLATLISTAVFTSAKNTLSKPDKVESYLTDSQIYTHFISYVTDAAEKAASDNDQSSTVSLNDAAIQSAAEAAFPKQLIQQSVNTFIDSNYDWLEGKSPTPNFRIDLTSQKLTFAQKVGEYAKTYVAGLPVCASPEQALQNHGGILSATCRPAELTPEAAQAQVAQQLSSNGNYLANTVITPVNINPDKTTASQPYYDKLSHLPKAYQAGLKLPYVFAILSLLFALGVIFISVSRRKGLRLAGIILLIAGMALVVLKFVSDTVFRHLENRIFNDTSIGQLQKSLTDFAHRIEVSMVRTELWFGIAFLLLAAIIFGVLAGTRKSGEPKSPDEAPELPDNEATAEGSAPVILSRKRLKPPLTGIPTGPRLGGEPPKPGAGTAPGSTAPGAPTVPESPKPSHPRPKKKPRLIQ
jgi:hypothetical protein